MTRLEEWLNEELDIAISVNREDSNGLDPWGLGFASAIQSVLDHLERFPCLLDRAMSVEEATCDGGTIQ